MLVLILNLVKEADKMSVYQHILVALDGSDQSEEMLTEKAKQASEIGVKTVKKIVELGSPKRYLANTISENYAIDLIVLGATGRGAIQRTLIGSTTDYVVNHALCNVLVVR